MPETSPGAPQPTLEIEDLCVSYFTRAGAVPAVIDFSLSLAPGESVGLVGESGCGKSTVAMAIMRYLGGNGRIVGGRVRFQGRDLAELSPAALRAVRGSQIAMVYQEPMAALNPSLTIGEQLCEIPRTHSGASRPEARALSLEMLRDVQLADPERMMNAYPHQVSGGQQQRAVIAMALLGRPALLVLDEPTTALDVTVEAGIVDLIAGLSRKFGMALLYISHNLGLMREVCDRIHVMYAGEVVEEGETETVFAKPRHPYTRGLLDCIPQPHAGQRDRPLTPIAGRLPLPHERPVGCQFGPRCDYFRPKACSGDRIRLADGVRCVRSHEINLEAPAAIGRDRQRSAAGERILEIDRLSKHYPVTNNGLRALVSGDSDRFVKANDAVRFEVREGETVAIVGESGCGKSTLARVLMGLETATAGAVRFDGNEIGQVATQHRTPAQRRALQMVFQNPDDTLNPAWSIGAQIGRVVRKFGIETSREKVAAQVTELLEMVQLPAAFASRLPRQLSGGQKQRVAIARALAGTPAVMIADEPISALDVSVAAAVIDLVLDIQARNRTTLVFISHDMGTVRYLADRVVVLYLGRVVEQGATERVFGPPYHPYTEALLSAVPVADPAVEKRRIVLDGPLPSALDTPQGCTFATRCPRRIGTLCDNEAPPDRVFGDSHRIACHLPAETLQAVEPVLALKRAAK